ncbi:MAG: SLBB domain-containing protein [Microthrixaceae bacterium]
MAGQVHHPGLYSVDAGGRLADAVNAAGGPTAQADLERVNLAEPLTDGARTYIPAIGQAEAPDTVPQGVPAPGDPVGEASGGAPGPSGAPVGPVNLNTADVGELEALPGVGPVTAEAIVAHRDEAGAVLPGGGPLEDDAASATPSWRVWPIWSLNGAGQGGSGRAGRCRGWPVLSRARGGPGPAAGAAVAGAAVLVGACLLGEAAIALGVVALRLSLRALGLDTLVPGDRGGHGHPAQRPAPASAASRRSSRWATAPSRQRRRARRRGGVELQLGDRMRVTGVPGGSGAVRVAPRPPGGELRVESVSDIGTGNAAPIAVPRK